MSLQLSEKDMENPDLLARKLMTLAEIIIRKHFYASVRDKEDLVSVGVLKAYDMIGSGVWDSKKGSNFASFLYTGMRNSMHNYLYHEYKFDTEDIDNALIDVGQEDLYFNNDTEVYISYSLIHAVCLRFIRVFGDNIEELVIRELKNMGYAIKGRREDNNPSSTFVYYSDVIIDEYGKSAEEEVISRLIAIIIWKKSDSDKE